MQLRFDPNWDLINGIPRSSERTNLGVSLQHNSGITPEHSGAGLRRGNKSFEFEVVGSNPTPQINKKGRSQGHPVKTDSVGLESLMNSQLLLILLIH